MQESIRPRAVEVTPLEDYHLLVVFDNDEQRVFDCHCLITGDFYGQLQDPRIYRKERENMIYITGDTHGDFSRYQAFTKRMKPTEEDVIQFLHEDITIL